MKNRKSGFTLIELLIVMAVIAALMGALVPVALNAINHANATRIAENLRSLTSQVQQYAYSDHQIPSIDDLKGSVSGANLTDYAVYTYSSITSAKVSSAKSLSNSTTTFAVVYIPTFDAKSVYNAWNGATAVANIGAGIGTGSVGATSVIVKYW